MVKKLKWYDDRFRSVYRFKSRVLTLEEANKRIHRYYPNLTILKYYRTQHPAEVYCSDCESTFITLYNISAYIYIWRNKNV